MNEWSYFGEADTVKISRSVQRTMQKLGGKDKGSDVNRYSWAVNSPSIIILRIKNYVSILKSAYERKMSPRHRRETVNYSWLSEE